MQRQSVLVCGMIGLLASWAVSAEPQKPDQAKKPAPAATAKKPDQTKKPAPAAAAQKPDQAKKPAAPRSPSLPPQEPEKTVLNEPLVVKAADWTLASFLDWAAKKTTANFVIREGLEQQKVKTVLSKGTARQILQKTLGDQGIALWPVGPHDTYFVARFGTAMPKDPSSGVADPRLDKFVTVSVDKSPLGVYMDSVGKQAGIKVGASGDIMALRVTASLRKVPARDALFALALMKGLTYRRDAKTGACEFSRATRAK
ncbi:MAG: hypothetical protein NTY77_07090 [Elusimicrobia bacterium]|nr:hypothetical protein [Elusimicrobiota bacterium]